MARVPRTNCDKEEEEVLEHQEDDNHDNNENKETPRVVGRQQGDNRPGTDMLRQSGPHDRAPVPDHQEKNARDVCLTCVEDGDGEAIG